MTTTTTATYDADLNEAERVYDTQVERDDFPEGEYEKARGELLNNWWVEGITIEEWVARATRGG